MKKLQSEYLNQRKQTIAFFQINIVYFWKNKNQSQLCNQDVTDVTCISSAAINEGFHNCHAL